MASGIKNGNKESPVEFGHDVFKIVVIGEPKCGKTTFIRAFVREHLPGPETSINGVHVYPCEFDINDEMRTVALYEIPSDPRFSFAQRAPHYEKATVLVYMYAIDDPSSLEMLSSKWVPETNLVIPVHASIVLLGNKKDLSNNQQVIDRLALNNQVPVTPEQASSLFPDIDDLVYMEISSLNSDEVLDAFMKIRSVISPLYFI